MDETNRRCSPARSRDLRAGADRAAFTFLIDSYNEEQLEKGTRVVLKLHPDIAPYKVAVLPLLKKRPEIVELCYKIKGDLQKDLMAVYDDTAAIGKLYRIVAAAKTEAVPAVPVARRDRRQHCLPRRARRPIADQGEYPHGHGRPGPGQPPTRRWIFGWSFPRGFTVP